MTDAERDRAIRDLMRTHGVSRIDAHEILDKDTEKRRTGTSADDTDFLR